MFHVPKTVPAMYELSSRCRLPSGISNKFYQALLPVVFRDMQEFCTYTYTYTKILLTAYRITCGPSLN